MAGVATEVANLHLLIFNTRLHHLEFKIWNTSNKFKPSFRNDLAPDDLIALTLIFFVWIALKNNFHSDPALIKPNGAKLHIACATLPFVSEQRQEAKQQGDVVTITNVAKYHNFFSKSGFSLQ